MRVRVPGAAAGAGAARRQPQRRRRARLRAALPRRLLHQGGEALRGGVGRAVERPVRSVYAYDAHDVPYRLAAVQGEPEDIVVIVI